MEFLLIIICFVLIIIMIKRNRSSVLTRSNLDLPGTKPDFLFGNLRNSGLLTGTTTFHEVLLDYQRRYGDKFLFWIGSNPIAVFCSREHAHTIFSGRNTFDQSPLFAPNFDHICSKGLVLLSGDTWKRHARVILPILKRSKISHHFDTIIKCTDHFVGNYIHHNQIHRNLGHCCQQLILSIIGSISFDCDLDTSTDASSNISLENFLFYASTITLMAWLPRWLVRTFLRLNWRYQRTLRFIRDLTYRIVDQERNQLKQSKCLVASTVPSLNENANDEQILSGITQAEMFDEILLLMVASYETTSSMISWFLFYMSKYPCVQKRMRNELYQYGLLKTNHNDAVPKLTEENIDQLIYCETVFRELLRLAPVVFGTTRIALHDTIVDDVPISRGQTVIVALHNTNRDERYWEGEDTAKFIPERFLDENRNVKPYPMFTFGGGHRACAGQDLAKLEVKLFMIRLMQHGLIFEDTTENTGGYQERLTCFPKKMAIRIKFEGYQYQTD